MSLGLSFLWPFLWPVVGPVVLCALLFVVFGLSRRRRGAGCGSCTTECPAKEIRHD